MAAPDSVQMQKGLWLWGYWWELFGSCWWGWGYRFTQVVRGVLWGCLEGLAKATMAGWRSSGGCLGGLGSGSGPSNFSFLHEKGKSTAEGSGVFGGGLLGVLTILGANLSSGGGVGLAYCKGGDRQFCAQLRADARNGVQKGGSAILGSAILLAILRQFWVQFLGNSPS